MKTRRDETIISVKHDWKKLLDGTLREAERGVDFNSPSTFRTRLYAAARKHGIRVTTRLLKNGNIQFQAKMD